ncbi:hypothetical protein CGZ93_07275 [Enemella dayhoffiae]|uniref:L,D-TPase catalytic domain-containing protein n=1 Tax=Enemella dayhoffiae TaxID=2016507 RepID=A0A255H6K1_9ACTN|nr:L,D-transpeptidase family protein [Enemella dayhoffiae]OYO22833.1 hypothetical protein CGZ93_07275 [Enemella dayhoffiae]
MKPVVSTAVGVAVAAFALTLPNLAVAAPTPGTTPSASASASPSARPTAAPTPRATASPASPTGAPSPTATASPVTVTPQIVALWTAQGGAAGWLGAPVGAETAVPGGVKQAYASGDIYYSSATGAHYVRGMIKKKYDELGGAGSALGLPTTNEMNSGAVADAKVNGFAGGTILWSPGTGAAAVKGAIYQKFAQLGYESVMGLPLGDEFNGQNNTIIGRFTNGVIVYAKDTGRVQAVRGRILDEYGVHAWEGGILGRPVSDEYPGASGAQVQNFEGGLIVWKPETGAHAVYGAIIGAFAATGYEGGALGAPTSGEYVGAGGAKVQNYQHGIVVFTPESGAQPVYGAILGAFAANGFETGPIGVPTSAEYAGANGARVQNFQHGQIVFTPGTGAHAVFGAIMNTYAAMGFEGGPLGAPVGPEYPGVPGTRIQNFQHGMIFWSPGTGAHAVYGAIRGEYGALRFEGGPLGLPISPEYNGAGGARVQNFQRGQIVFTPGGGARGVYGAIWMTFADMGYEGGPLGAPVSGEYAGARQARVQNFRNGLVVYTPRTGAYAVRGAILQEYGRQGYEGGRMGAPIGDELPIPGGWSQDFEFARIEFVNNTFRIVWPGPKVDARCMTGRVMCISKADRKLRWMINGQVVREMDARFGAAATPTREGEFSVFSMVRDEISYLYGNTPMPFAMYFSGGQAVHYSYDFAARGYAGASHGCVNIRDWNGIQWLFDTQVRRGDKVVVYW